MNARDTILQRIRTKLAGQPPLAPPPVPEVWPPTGADQAALATRFAEELQAVHGETIRCRSIEQVQRQLADLAAAGSWSTIGAVDTPAARKAVTLLKADSVAWTHPDWKPTDIAGLSAGVVTAEILLADTGSSAIVCRTAEERLMCYLPPVCVVLARAAQLVEHLPAAWPQIAARCVDPAARGEIVLVTGPSRTADIEKILILGVHGPKRLVVLLQECEG